MALTDADRALLARCLAGEPGAWRDFVDRFLPLFAHVIQHTAHARSISLQHSDIEDLCADVLLALSANDLAVLRRFRGKASLATYLVVVARRVVVREMVRRRMAEALGHVRYMDNVSEVQPLTEESPSRRIEDRELIQKMLNGLSDRDAEIVKLFHLEGKTYHEISQRTGVPENSIGPTLTRAIDRLRQRAASHS